MYFQRAIDAELAEWAESADRRPLVLRGARQVGKTAAVRALGEGFDLFVELNLERHADRTLLEQAATPADLLTALAVRHDRARFPARTLLFIDEIQESAKAVRWLRALYEDHPELLVVAAGSFLEVRLNERGFSFPVGRVTFRYLHPFTWLEFVRACGQGALAERATRAALRLEPMPAPVDEIARGLLGDYLLVGGMPAAVERWVAGRSPVEVRQVQTDLVQAFAEDLQKYRGVRDLAYLEAAFHHLTDHYGRRFKYAHFVPGYRTQLMQAALGKLEGAMIVHRALPTSSVTLPIEVKPRAAPKLVPLDVGVALAAMNVPPGLLATRPVDTLLDGRVAEMLVGQALRGTQLRTDTPLHFWVRESARANAEVDYLVVGPDGLRPVEVKGGKSGRLRSLHQLLARAPLATGYRLHTGPIEVRDERVSVAGAGPLRYRLVSLPLYLAELVREAGTGAGA